MFGIGKVFEAFIESQTKDAQDKTAEFWRARLGLRPVSRPASARARRRRRRSRSPAAESDAGGADRPDQLAAVVGQQEPGHQRGDEHDTGTDDGGRAEAVDERLLGGGGEGVALRAADAARRRRARRPGRCRRRRGPARADRRSTTAMPDAYCDVTTEPRTATPSAPPSSRVVSFIAEPTPARPSGTDDMISVVSGVMVMAMPERQRDDRRVDVEQRAVDADGREQRQAEWRSSRGRRAPRGRRRSGPTTFGTRGATVMMMKANGSWSRPDSSGE